MFLSIMRVTTLGIASSTLLASVITAELEESADTGRRLSNIMATVNYTDPYDGTELMGYSVVPGDLNAEDNKDGRPLVVVIPDWDGVNE